MIKEGILTRAKDHFLKGTMKQALNVFLKQLRKFECHHKYLEMVTWMSYAVDSYFQKMSEIGNKLSVVCHSDFTQGNVMVEEGADEKSGGRRRVGFIDWQSHFEGNPFIDLTFILFYGLDPQYWDISLYS